MLTAFFLTPSRLPPLRSAPREKWFCSSQATHYHNKHDRRPTRQLTYKCPQLGLFRSNLLIATIVFLTHQHATQLRHANTKWTKKLTLVCVFRCQFFMASKWELCATLAYTTRERETCEDEERLRASDVISASRSIYDRQSLATSVQWR